MRQGASRGFLPVAALLLTAALLAGCGSGSPDRLRKGKGPIGVAAVTGGSLEKWGLLELRPGGGKSVLHSASDPGQVLEEGATELPAFDEAHVLEGGAVVLRGRDGFVYRYDPRTEELVKGPRVPADATWSASGSSGLFRTDSTVVEVSLDDFGSYRLDRPVLWATPLSKDGLLALVGGGEHALWTLREGEDKPTAQQSVRAAPPGVLTAWGERLVLTGGDSSRSLPVFAVPELQSVGTLDAGGIPRVLAASPSSHAIYVGMDAPPRVVAVSRFTGDRSRLARLPELPTALRSSLFGGFLLARSGDSTYFLPLTGGDARALPGSWRSDLPLGLPEGRVLAASGGEVVEWSASSGRTTPTKLAADSRWLPIRWHPGTPQVVAGRVAGESVAPESARAAPGAAVPEAPESTAEGQLASEASPEGAAGPPPPTTVDTSASQPPAEPPPGFYAIVVSARSPASVTSLLGDLSSAGYPTATQRHRDDAGQLWYRGLVGPYPDRSAAEAAARQLRRERGLQVWVTDISGGAGEDELLR